MCKVYTGYHGTSKIEPALCACTGDNPLPKARGLSLRTSAQTMLSLTFQKTGRGLLRAGAFIRINTVLRNGQKPVSSLFFRHNQYLPRKVNWYISRGRNCHFHVGLPYKWGSTLKGHNLLLLEQLLSGFVVHRGN